VGLFQAKGVEHEGGVESAKEWKMLYVWRWASFTVGRVMTTDLMGSASSVLQNNGELHEREEKGIGRSRLEK